MHKAILECMITDQSLENWISKTWFAEKKKQGDACALVTCRDSVTANEHLSGIQELSP